MRTKLSVIVAASLLLTGCGGAKEEQEHTQAIDYSQLKTTPQTTQALSLEDASRVKQHIANGLRLQLSNGGYKYLDDGLTPEPTPSAGDDSVSGESGSYSQTNVHVEGVDEGDITKYDGRHWFIAHQPHYSTYSADNVYPAIHVVATDPAAPNAEIVGQLQLDDRWSNIDEMYLVNDGQTTRHIASIRNLWGDVLPYLPGVPIDLQLVDPAVSTPGARAFSIPEPQNSQVRVQLLDVSTPSVPTEDWEVKIDGSLIDSRKVDNTLYLITRFAPWLSDLLYEYGDTSVRESNEKILADAQPEQLMPHYYIGGSKTPLSNECFLQTNTNEYYGYSSLVNVTAIDLASQRVIGSTCLNSGVEALSMSRDSLYLTGTSYDGLSNSQQTVIHKFNLTPMGAQYAASGSVSGGLGWSSDPAFRMHEAGDQFRIVTSQRKNGTTEHQLSILLDDNSGALSSIATLPNDANPTPIGKPNEDIFSVRFQGDTAYIVTFQRTDPLYAIDLSDPYNPRVTGELEIPGFATYMHPLPNDHIFTLGHDADENGRTLGIKAELIKVTDGTPEVINTILIGGESSRSEALSNLRALSVLTVSDDQVRFAFPVTVYQDGYQTWQYSGLQLLQVDGLTDGSAQLIDRGTLTTERRTSGQEYPSGQGTVRGILHDDAAFFTFNRGIWAANWDAPQEAIGPILAEPIACTTEAVSGLHVTVTVESESEVDPCAAKVSATGGDGTEILNPADFTHDGRSCTFLGASEAPGQYVVTATMPGFSKDETFVSVPQDACHVIPQEVNLVLKEQDTQVCTDEARPSISLDLSADTQVTGSDNINLCSALVFAAKDGALYPLEALPTPMARPGDEPYTPTCGFHGPFEVSGSFVIEISHPNYEQRNITDVVVAKDECHVITEHRSVILKSL